MDENGVKMSKQNNFNGNSINIRKHILTKPIENALLDLKHVFPPGRHGLQVLFPKSAGSLYQNTQAERVRFVLGR